MRKLLYIFIITFFLPSFAFATAESVNLKPIDYNEINNISSERLSLQMVVDDSGNTVCNYQEANGRSYLFINKDIFKTDNVLMGISNPDYCPLPGQPNFKGYEKTTIGSNFLLSGIICVVQSVVLDSMFRVYCTILLWVYQILYAGIVIYIMFYGMAIMFDLTDEPLKEAPKRIMKIFFILFFAVNAERAFYFIHGGFMNILNGFSNMLTSVQPLYTEDGMIAYNTEGKLLDEEGKVWRALPYDAEAWDPESEVYVSVYSGNEPEGYEQIAIDNLYEYKSFRIPAMQWVFDPQDEYKLYPVFQEVSGLVEGKFTCIRDYKYNFKEERLEVYPRCHPQRWPTMPNIAPYGLYCVYNKTDNQNTGCLPVPEPLVYPPKLKNIPGNGRNGMAELCDENTPPAECRQPFQSVMGKIDAMFNSVVGQDRVRSLGTMMMALMLWGFGGGALLGLFLMLGIMTMFAAFMQILWTYITAIMALSFMMMLSPLFISFALFKVTERMFRGWVSNLISYALQPILALGIILALSRATTLDRLTMMARHEVGIKKMEIKSADDGTVTTASAPGFLEPLYEVPPDYDKVLGGRSDVNTDSINCDPNTEDCAYLTAAQRAEYVKQKEIELIVAYSMLSHGFYGNDACTQKSPNFSPAKVNFDAVLCNSYKNALANTLSPANVKIKRLRELMDSGGIFDKTFPDPNNPGGTTTKQVELKGINAVVASGEIPEFVSLYEDTIGIPDEDGFLGEGDLETAYPNWLFGNGNARVTNQPHQEFPRCVKHCPAYVPPYHPVDNPDPLPGSCMQFCLYLFALQSSMFAYLMGAVLTWIVLNVVIGAFVTKIPMIAQMLSLFDPRVTAARIFGLKSQKMYSTPPGSAPQYGMSAYSSEEEYSGLYNMGSVFDVGVYSGTSGSVVAGIDKIRRIGSGPQYRVNDKLERQEVPMKTWNDMLRQQWGSPFSSNASPAAQAIASFTKDEMVKEMKEYLQDKATKEGKVLSEQELEEMAETQTVNTLKTKLQEGYFKNETSGTVNANQQRAKSVSSDLMDEYKKNNPIKDKKQNGVTEASFVPLNAEMLTSSPREMLAMNDEPVKVKEFSRKSKDFASQPQMSKELEQQEDRTIQFAEGEDFFSDSKAGAKTAAASVAATMVTNKLGQLAKDPEFQRLVKEKGMEAAMEEMAAKYDKKKSNDNEKAEDKVEKQEEKSLETNLEERVEADKKLDTKPQTSPVTEKDTKAQEEEKKDVTEKDITKKTKAQEATDKQDDKDKKPDEILKTEETLEAEKLNLDGDGTKQKEKVSITAVAPKAKNKLLSNNKPTEKPEIGEDESEGNISAEVAEWQEMQERLEVSYDVNINPDQELDEESDEDLDPEEEILSASNEKEIIPEELGLGEYQIPDQDLQEKTEPQDGSKKVQANLVAEVELEQAGGITEENIATEKVEAGALATQAVAAGEAPKQEALKAQDHNKQKQIAALAAKKKADDKKLNKAKKKQEEKDAAAQKNAEKELAEWQAELNEGEDRAGSTIVKKDKKSKAKAKEEAVAEMANLGEASKEVSQATSDSKKADADIAIAASSEKDTNKNTVSDKKEAKKADEIKADAEQSYLVSQEQNTNPENQELSQVEAKTSEDKAVDNSTAVEEKLTEATQPQKLEPSQAEKAKLLAAQKKKADDLKKQQLAKAEAKKASKEEEKIAAAEQAKKELEEYKAELKEGEDRTSEPVSENVSKAQNKAEDTKQEQLVTELITSGLTAEQALELSQDKEFSKLASEIGTKAAILEASKDNAEKEIKSQETDSVEAQKQGEALAALEEKEIDQTESQSDQPLEKPEKLQPEPLAANQQVKKPQIPLKKKPVSKKKVAATDEKEPSKEEIAAKEEVENWKKKIAEGEDRKPEDIVFEDLTQIKEELLAKTEEKELTESGIAQMSNQELYQLVAGSEYSGYADEPRFLELLRKYGTLYLARQAYEEELAEAKKAMAGIGGSKAEQTIDNTQDTNLISQQLLKTDKFATASLAAGITAAALKELAEDNKFQQLASEIGVEAALQKMQSEGKLNGELSINTDAKNSDKLTSSLAQQNVDYDNQKDTSFTTNDKAQAQTANTSEIDSMEVSNLSTATANQPDTANEIADNSTDITLEDSQAVTAEATQAEEQQAVQSPEILEQGAEPLDASAIPTNTQKEEASAPQQQSYFEAEQQVNVEEASKEAQPASQTQQAQANNYFANQTEEKNIIQKLADEYEKNKEEEFKQFMQDLKDGEYDLDSSGKKPTNQYVRGGVQSVTATATPDLPADAPTTQTPDKQKAEDAAIDANEVADKDAKTDSRTRRQQLEDKYAQLGYGMYVDDPGFIELAEIHGPEEALRRLNGQQQELPEQNIIANNPNSSANQQTISEEPPQAEEPPKYDQWLNEIPEEPPRSLFEEALSQPDEIAYENAGNASEAGSFLSGINNDGLVNDGGIGGAVASKVNQALYGGGDGKLQDPSESLQETLSQAEQIPETPSAAGDESTHQLRENVSDTREQQQALAASAATTVPEQPEEATRTMVDYAQESPEEFMDMLQEARESNRLGERPEESAFFTSYSPQETPQQPVPESEQETTPEENRMETITDAEQADMAYAEAGNSVENNNPELVMAPNSEEQIADSTAADLPEEVAVEEPRMDEDFDQTVDDTVAAREVENKPDMLSEVPPIENVINGKEVKSQFNISDEAKAKIKKTLGLDTLEDVVRTELDFKPEYDDAGDKAARADALSELEAMLQEEEIAERQKRIAELEEAAKKAADDEQERLRLENEAEEERKRLLALEEERKKAEDNFNQDTYLQLRNMVQAELQSIFDKRFADDDTGRAYVATRQMISNFETDQSFKSQATGSTLELEFKAREIANQLIRTYKTTA